jgi:hypothetical protein
MNVAVVNDLKVNYEEWVEVFQSWSQSRSDWCDESKTVVGKVNDRKAVTLLFGIDHEKMHEAMDNSELQEVRNRMVSGSEMFILNPSITRACGDDVRELDRASI